MIAEPKRAAGGRLRSQLYEGGLMIECEITQPPSTKGRTVWVHFPQDKIAGLLRDTRTAAVSARATPDPHGARP